MRETKTEAKTIQDAVEKGLAELGLRRDQVEVVVVSEGKSGFLGIGAKKACVILREKRWGESRSEEPRGSRPGGRGGDRGGRGGDRGGRGGRSGGRGGRPGGRSEGRGERPSAAAPRRPGRYGYEDARLPPQEETTHSERPHREDRMSRNDRVYQEEPLGADYQAIQPAQDPVEHAKTALLKMLTLMGVEATITEAKLDTAENLLFIRFDCAEPAAFTEDNGRGLQSLQFILNSIVSRKREPHLALRLDTGGYWDSKEKEIAARVEEAVREARAGSVSSRLDPMPASMRKIVHNLVKANYPDMETVSEGEGRWRKVVIRKTATHKEPQAAAQQEVAQPAPAEQPVPQQAEEAAAVQPEQTTTEQK
ncbi:MAG: Jag N-terminal domain-containing protein [Elusimicrobiales bacterium]|nr:Jag N-terminal domain-containing protein [Elusimicrobiales bacterium]